MTVGANETVRAVLSAVPVDVAFVTLQFHAQDHNATLSYTRVRRWGGVAPGPRGSPWKHFWAKTQMKVALNRVVD